MPWYIMEWALFPPLCSFMVWTQVTRLTQPAPLLNKSPCWPKITLQKEITLFNTKQNNHSNDGQCLLPGTDVFLFLTALNTKSMTPTKTALTESVLTSAVSSQLILFHRLMSPQLDPKQTNVSLDVPTPQGQCLPIWIIIRPMFFQLDPKQKNLSLAHPTPQGWCLPRWILSRPMSF